MSGKMRKEGTVTCSSLPRKRCWDGMKDAFHPSDPDTAGASPLNALCFSDKVSILVSFISSQGAVILG